MSSLSIFWFRQLRSSNFQRLKNGYKVCWRGWTSNFCRINHFWKKHVRSTFRRVHSEPIEQPLKISSQHWIPWSPNHYVSAGILFFHLICRYPLFKNSSVPDEMVIATFTNFQTKTTNTRCFSHDPSLNIRSPSQKILTKGIPKVACSILIQMVKVSNAQNLQPAIYIRM